MVAVLAAAFGIIADVQQNDMQRYINTAVAVAAAACCTINSDGSSNSEQPICHTFLLWP